jgi:hypothetical protein
LTKLDALNYGEAVELTFTINEFSVVIEGLEVRAILPISYDQKMLLTIKDSSHLPLHVPKDFDLQKNYIRRLNFVCIIKV